jgi:hypothetical protein
MYSLRKGNKNGLIDEEEIEYEDHNINLKDYQWDQLDEIAEEKDESRNQVVRNIVDQYFAIRGLIDFRSIEGTLEDIVSKLELILDEVEEKKDPSVEVSGVTLKRVDGGPGSKKVAKIIHESKDEGIERGRVEAITGKSEKPATRIMRVMADEFDHLEFKKGNNNRPSKLFHRDYLPGG